MDDTDRQHLRMRLTNCLQTILDLEPELDKLELSEMLRQEYTVLRSFMDTVDQVELHERDVRRIEEATESFLQELRGPLAALRKKSPPSRGPMQ